MSEKCCPIHFRAENGELILTLDGVDYRTVRTCELITVSEDARDFPCNIKCSSCGEFVYSLFPESGVRYCPNCGAKVVSHE